jgi:hypothetical protein
MNTLCYKNVLILIEFIKIGFYVDEVLGDKPFPETFCSPQIPHDLTWNRT